MRYNWISIQTEIVNLLEFVLYVCQSFIKHTKASWVLCVYTVFRSSFFLEAGAEVPGIEKYIDVLWAC